MARGFARTKEFRELVTTQCGVVSQPRCGGRFSCSRHEIRLRPSSSARRVPWVVVSRGGINCAIGLSFFAIPLIQLGGAWTNFVETSRECQSITGRDPLADRDDTEPDLAPVPERAVASGYELRQIGLYRGDALFTRAGTAYERSCGND